MSKTFDIPIFYRSPIISAVKSSRKKADHYKKDLEPTIIDLGPLRFKIARHFGFCYGVENAIDITYRAVKENPDGRIFLLSEMIHNPHVNANLTARGVRFIMKTNGEYLIPFEDLLPTDIVIIPAFGTTEEMFEKLKRIGIDPQIYNATCPFVEKVWKRSAQLGEKGYTVIIHGKHSHEETRATFSHAHSAAPALIIGDIEEARLLARYIRKEIPRDKFLLDFPDRTSPSFEPEQHLQKIGVVNQTTMLATETRAISLLLRQAITDQYGKKNASEHFADTRDTLCYATSENQQAMNRLIESGGELAIIVGGYNSSNTTHLVELCANRVPAYYIQDSDEILDEKRIRHLDLRTGTPIITTDWLPSPGHDPIEILITAGASCPDALVESVIEKISEFYGATKGIAKALHELDKIC